MASGLQRAIRINLVKKFTSLLSSVSIPHDYLMTNLTIAFQDGLLGVAFLMLTVVIPKQASPNRQRLQIYLWTAVILIVYSILVSIFRVKNRGMFQPSLGLGSSRLKTLQRLSFPATLVRCPKILVAMLHVLN